MTEARKIVLLAAAAVGLAVGVAVADDASSDPRFLAGLRSRALFELAEAYCEARLAEPDLPDARRAGLTVELSLASADRAVNSPPAERPPLWQRAWQVTEAFAEQYPDSPRLPLVRFQGALGLVARGELARQESELVADNRALVEEARSQLRSAIRQIDQLAEDVDARLRGPGSSGRTVRGPNEPEPLTEYQLAALEKNVQYQLARAYRNQAQCYAPDSPDRANSLTRALGLLDPLAELDASHPLAFKSRLDEIACYRLLSDYAAAARKLDALAALNPSPAVALRGRAERIRLALASGKTADAVALLARGRTIDGTHAPELDFAWLETYLQAWRAANGSDDRQTANAWQSKANEMVQRIEQEHGPYWTRRAEMLLAGYVRTSSGGGGLEMQVRAAESSFRSGRPDDALAAYDRAAEMARQQADPARAFELGYTAAAIEHQRNRHAEAMHRFRSLALADPTQPKAAEAHLLAIYHAEQIARAESGDAVQGYVALLQEHLAHWPDGPAADQVRWRLGRLREHQRDWQNAIAAYRAISAEFDRPADVVEAAARCYRAWLDERAAAGQPTEATADEAAAWLESLVLGAQQTLPDTWTPATRAAALEAARLRLDYTGTGYDRAERILAAALADPADASGEWTSAARAMLVFSLAGQGRRDEAADALRQLSAGPPDQLLGMLQGLARVAASARPESKPDWARLVLEAVALLEPRRDQLDPAGRQTLERLKAQALADAGRPLEAQAAYQWLTKVYPRDGEIQEAYARLLASGQDRGSLEAALGQWRHVESGSRPGSDRWFRAKYEVALLHLRLGNRAQAEKMIKLLEVLHPELGGPAMKARFDTLMKRASEGR